jgi:capsular polysaccharide transport system permease protein
MTLAHPMSRLPVRRSTVQVWIDVVSALLLREVQTRFGKRRFGALWLVAEPLLGVLLIVLIVGSRHPLTGGVDTAGFVLAWLGGR